MRTSHATIQRDQLLLAIKRRDGTVKQHQLMKVFDTSKQHISDVVARVADDGYIVCEHGPHAVVIELTEQGREHEIPDVVRCGTEVLLHA